MHHTTYYSRWMLVRVIFSLVNTVNNVVYVVAADNKKKKKLVVSNGHGPGLLPTLIIIIVPAAFCLFPMHDVYMNTIRSF